MSDALSLLEASCKKLSTRVEKLRTQLEAAETELMENQTAIKVLSRMGVSPTVDAKLGTKPTTQEQVRGVLPTHEGDALTPREVHQALDGAISADNVRTVLSRLKNNKGTDVRVTDGRYWREVEDEEPTGAASADDFDDLPDFEVPRRPRPVTFDDDLDEDTPF